MAADTPKRKRGRPRVEDGARLSIVVRQADYDRVARIAIKSDRSISAVVRDALKLRLKAED